MSSGPPKPPRLARRLLALLLPKDRAAQVTTDLDEEHARFVVAERGRVRAALWYWRQVILSIPRLIRLESGSSGWRLDARYALRMITRRPTFSVMAIFTLALGTAIATSTFAVLHAVLLEPLPYEHTERLVRPMPNELFFLDSHGAQAFAERMTTLDAAAAWGRTLFAFDGEGDAEEVRGARVSWNHFDMLGVRPALGRAFAREDAAAGRTLVIADALWRRRFGADPSVIGASISVAGQQWSVIGVMGPEHVPMESDWQAWTTLPLDPAEAEGSGMVVNGRLRAGVGLEQAETEMRSVLEEVLREGGGDVSDEDRAGMRLVGLGDWLLGEVRQGLLFLSTAVGLLLLLACLNVGTMLIAQGRVRAREFAVRAALGAGRLRVARQVVVEVTAVAFLGGMVGLGLSGVSLSALVALLPPEMPRVTQIGMSPLVALFAVACMVFATLTVSWITAGRALREVAGGLGARDLAGPHGRRLRSLLVGVETALAIVLVVGAGLLMRSLIAVAAVDPGFDPSGVVTFRPTPTSSAYPNASIERFYADLAEGLERLPAVASVGAIQFLPMTPGAWWGSYRLEGDADVDESRRTGMRVTAGDYFDAMRISIVAGRSFDEPERGGEGPPVAVVNERFARDAFGAEPAVGRTVLLPGVDEGVRVIGVVADVRQSDLYTETHPEMYVPLPRVPWRRMHVVVRVDGDPGAVLDAARAVVAELDPNAPVLGPTLLSDIVEDTFGRARLYATMMVVFGALGLALGAVGIYGVTAQSVVERRREIGIRLALGAERPSVVGRTVLEGLGPVAVGLAVGLALVVAGAGWLEGLLFGVGTRDPGTLLGAPLLLVVVALTALLLPAVRAAGVDPVATLREE